MTQKFVHLHVHSNMSLLDGLSSPSILAEKAAEMGFPAIAVTDHGSISGAIKLAKSCKEHGIKPIIGIEAYFTDDAVQKESREKLYHILLLAKNDNGLRSLYRLMTKAHDNFYYKPRIDLEMLNEAEDLIVSTACFGGLLAHPNYEKLIKQLYDRWKEDLYLEIMPLNHPTQVEVNDKAEELSKKYGIKIIATNDIHYLRAEDHKLHNFLLAMNTGGRLQFEFEGLWLKDYDQMITSFAGMAMPPHKKVVEKALKNTLEVMDKCNVAMEAAPVVLPRIVEENPVEALREAVQQGIEFRYPDGFHHQERVDYELKVIEEKNFVDYFLLVYDFINWCITVNIPLGAGRGSSAGSLVCYLLRITDIDPITEGLMFERFLNPERSDYPDIDLDLPQSKRHLAIQYLKDRYGEERVSYISTVSELKMRSAFKDVAKQLGIPFMIANQLTDLLDDESDLNEVMRSNAMFKEKLTSEQQEDLLYYTNGLKGTMRHASKHAAGIVVAPSKISDYGILEYSKEERSINWTMDDVSHQGLVKLDVLGLKALDIIGEALDLIAKRHKKTIDWTEVDVASPEILQAFTNGNTHGIFQFGTAKTSRLVKRLYPIESKNILVDCNALVRPGPADSGMTDQYIKRHTLEDTSREEPYVPWLDEANIGKDTYSVIIYQEQVIQVLCLLAGYSIPQADIVRRVFAKKKGDMEAHRPAFLEGCKKISNMPPAVAGVLYDHLITFSKYGFNKSHAAAYTELGLRQMWLKVNYPLEYMTALFMWEDEEEKKQKYSDECRRLGIGVLNPDINISKSSFTIDHDNIRIGLEAIKQIGDKTIDAVLRQRRHRRFGGVKDFCLRIPKNIANSRVVKNLVMAGAFDTLEPNQKAWVEGIDLMKPKDMIPTPQDVEDFTLEEKEINKSVLIPGVYKMNIEPSIGLNINQEELENIKEVIYLCKCCELRPHYNCPVGMEYTADSKLMVIAEAPGEEEVAQGRPLAPPKTHNRRNAGSVLRDLFKEIGVQREDLYLTNVYKCRPWENKLPKNTPKECYEILLGEIEVLEPKLIVAFGNRAREFFTGEASGIQQAADRMLCEPEIVGKRVIPVLYSVHPASCLYANGQENFERMRNTMKVVKSIWKGGK